MIVEIVSVVCASRTILEPPTKSRPNGIGLTFIITMEIEGKQLTSEQFAQKLKEIETP